MTQTLEPPVRVAPRAHRPRRRRAWWLLGLAVPTLAILTYMLSAYVPPDIATSRVPMHGDAVHYWLLVAHIATATVATVTGLAQFWPALRRRYPRVHRWTGRAYFFLGIFPSILLAIPVAAMSQFGIGNMSALYTLIVLWAGTGVAGLVAVRRRRYADHRKWMIRNYAITLASLASRPWQIIMAMIVLSQANSPMYRGDEAAIIHDIASSSAWMAIIVNVVVAELYIQRRYGGTRNQARAAVTADR